MACNDAAGDTCGACAAGPRAVRQQRGRYAGALSALAALLPLAATTMQGQRRVLLLSLTCAQLFAVLCEHGRLTGWSLSASASRFSRRSAAQPGSTSFLRTACGTRVCSVSRGRRAPFFCRNPRPRVSFARASEPCAARVTPSGSRQAVLFVATCPFCCMHCCVAAQFGEFDLAVADSRFASLHGCSRARVVVAAALTACFSI